MIRALFIVIGLFVVSELSAQNAWEPLPRDPALSEGLGLSHIAVDQSGGVWAFRDSHGAYRSLDNGATFSYVWGHDYMSVPGSVLASHFDEGGRMYVGTQGAAVIFTDDFGGVFQSYQPGPANWVRAIAVTKGGALLVGTGSGIYALGEVELGWGYRWPKRLEASHVYDLLVLPDGIILAGAEGGIYRSTDDGQTWSHVHTPYRSNIYALGRLSGGRIIASADFGGCNTLPANGSGGVYVSDDNGVTWSVSNSGMTTPFGACLAPVSDLIVTPSDEVILGIEYTAAGGWVEPGVFLSTDGGNTWQKHFEGLLYSGVNAAGQSNAVQPKQFAASADGTVYLFSGAGSERDMIYIRRAVATSTDDESVAHSFRLDAAYPNPFNPTTTISYTLDEPQHVRLSVYDQLGRRVAVLVDAVRPAGPSEVIFEADALPSGVYRYRLESGGKAISQAVTLMR